MRVMWHQVCWIIHRRIDSGLRVSRGQLSQNKLPQAQLSVVLRSNAAVCLVLRQVGVAAIRRRRPDSLSAGATGIQYHRQA